MTWLALLIIRLYQLLLSPLLYALGGQACRFEPSYSVYAQEVLRRDGLRLGLPKALRRLSRCHPFHEGGYDPP